ncbi:hypothetical protein BJX76DRAFT_362146 [Aspergillus varians]
MLGLETLCQSLAAVALKLPDAVIQPATQDIEHQVRAVLTWLSAKANAKFLLIYDNVDQETTLEPAGTINGIYYHISDFLPPACHGSFIITTRNMDLSKRVRLGELYSVKRLPLDKSMQLLMNSDGAVSDMQPELDCGLLTLANRLDGLPLALVVASAFMRSTGTQSAESLEIYSDFHMWSDIHEETNIDGQYANGNIVAALRMSYDEVKKRHPLAAQLLLLLSCYDNRDIWYAMIRSSVQQFEPAWLSEITSNEAKFRVTIARLINFGLVEPTTSTGYSMHPVVQDWCRHQRQIESTGCDFNKTNIETFTILALGSIARCIPSEHNPGARKLQRRLLPHAIHIIQSLDLSQFQRYELDTTTPLVPLIQLCHAQEDEKTL